MCLFLKGNFEENTSIELVDLCSTPRREKTMPDPRCRFTRKSFIVILCSIFNCMSVSMFVLVARVCVHASHSVGGW